MALTPRQRRQLDSKVGAVDQDAQIAALESEEQLLSPYATTKDLPKLKERLKVIRHRIAVLKGFLPE